MVSTVAAYAYSHESGGMSAEPLQVVSTITPGLEGEASAGSEKFSTGAALRIHPGGEFLYASNRGQDSIAIFRIGGDGRLTWCASEPTGGGRDCGGGTRDFDISPCGRFLVVGNQDINTVAVYRIDAASGRLTRTCEVASEAPVCVRILPAPSGADRGQKRPREED